MKAGQLFICVCCRDETPESEAAYDDDLDGPVCQMCRKDMGKAQAWLKAFRIHPVTQTKHNRIK